MRLVVNPLQDFKVEAVSRAFRAKFNSFSEEDVINEFSVK